MNTKQLRQKILDLAIRGKLVPQDPADEPASVLLERVRAEKERLIKEGKIKCSKTVANPATSDKSHYGQFEIPNTWVWTCLRDVCELSNGIAKRKGETGNSAIVLRLADLAEDNVDFSSPREIILTDAELEQYRLEIGDLLFVRVNGSKPNVGKAYLYEHNAIAAFCDHLMRGRVSANIYSTYIQHAMLSTDCRHHVDGLIVTTAGQNTISQVSLNSTRIPLPPFAEQHRIVAAIESAFAVIGEIEQNKTDLLSAITSAKQKILSLAIRGKLVSQDPTDEPASVLLERIREGREQLVKAGKTKVPKSKKSAPASVDNSYYAGLPESWVFCRLSEIGDIVGGGTPSTLEPSYWDGNIPWITPADLSGYTHKSITSGGRSITERGLAESSAKLIPANCILFSSRAPIGYCVISENVVCTNQGFKSVVPFANGMDEYIYYFLTAQVEEIRSRASGTTFKEISGAELGNTIFTLPPLAEQQRIVVAIETAFEQLDNIAATLT